MTTVFDQGRALSLTDADELGRGGEARVFRVGSWAVKVYHPDADLPEAERDHAAARRRLALRKVRAFPVRVPSAVVRPLRVVTDARGEGVGYVMEAVEGGVELGRLPPWRKRPAGGQNAVLRLFASLARVLSELHATGIVVGDLNDGNVLVVGDEPHLIDADSMQVGGLPCPVAHERFLEPSLYGVDLAAAPRFSTATDAYAFAVLLFTALVGMHPFGGSHPRYPTLLRRAQARHSVLRGDVRVPSGALPPGALPRPLTAYFAAVLEDGHRGLPPSDVLATTFRRCPCGLEHGAPSCPLCGCGPRHAPKALRTPAASASRVVVDELARAQGTFVRVAVVNGRLLTLDADGDVHVREDGSFAPVELRAGARVELAAGRTWFGHGGRVRAFGAPARGSADDDPFDADEAFGETMYTLCRREPVAVVAGWLTRVRTGERLGLALAGQTWIRGGPTFGVGFFRTGALAKVFTFDPMRPGLTYLTPSGPRGRLVDAAATFDDEHALLSWLEEDGHGHRTGQVVLVRRDGVVLATARGSADDDALFASTQGRAVAGGVVALATDAGLRVLAPQPDGKGFVVVDEYPETLGLVGTDDELLTLPEGALGVVGPRVVTRLRVG